MVPFRSLERAKNPDSRDEQLLKLSRRIQYKFHYKINDLINIRDLHGSEANPN